MTNLTRLQLLDAAAHALIIERCRRAHWHDVRGGLQSLRGAIELLTRAASGAVPNLSLTERSSALAQRAMASHEKLLSDWTALASTADEAAADVDLGESIGEIAHFLQNEAIERSVSLRVQALKGLRVVIPPRRCRLYLLGVCALALDEIPPAGVAELSIVETHREVLLEFKSALRREAILEARELWDETERSQSESQGESELTTTALDLVVSLTRHWLTKHGGRAEWQQMGSTGVLRLYFPAALS